MPNGKPGDHPYTDIVVHGLDVYSPAVANLIREIDRLASEKERKELSAFLYAEFNVMSNPDVAKLERMLTKRRDELVREARARGFEI